MRTSKKRIIEMQKEAMAFLGVKTLAELETHREKANAYFSRKLGKHGLACIQLSPYRGGVWQVSGIVPQGSTFFFETVSLENWMDEPLKTAQIIVEKYARQSWKLSTQPWPQE